jgi:three-Cys-motif partner protein
MQMQSFGGEWSETKALKVYEYLQAYATALKNKPFRLTYIDAFAGTGYRRTRTRDERQESFFPAEEDEVRDGSVRYALRVNPPFDRYVLVEKSGDKLDELGEMIGADFPELRQRVELVGADCNEYLPKLCRQWEPRRDRGVLYLDPFATEVHWKTLETVAQTQRIDMLVLFPLSAVNRMLPRNGHIRPEWEPALDRTFGTSQWKRRLYRRTKRKTLFGEDDQSTKAGSWESIMDFYLERLRHVFAAVAPRPWIVRKTRGTPLFALCFAVGNPSKKARDLALRMADHILTRSPE